MVWRPIICNILFPHYPNIEDKKQRVLLRLKGFLVNLKHDARHNCWYFFEAEAYCLIYMAKVPSVSRLIHSITINNIRSKRRPNRALLKENIRQNMCASIIINNLQNRRIMKNFIGTMTGTIYVTTDPALLFFGVSLGPTQQTLRQTLGSIYATERNSCQKQIG